MGPKNARKFVKWLKEDSSETLNGVRYTVFGCGDTNWASTYQEIPTYIDEKLSERGAIRLFPKGQGDASNDFEKQYEEWHNQVWPYILEAFGLEIDSSSKQANASLTLQFVKGFSNDATPHEAGANNQTEHIGVLPQN